jgi:hypothetical protein
MRTMDKEVLVQETVASLEESGWEKDEQMVEDVRRALDVGLRASMRVSGRRYKRMKQQRRLARAWSHVPPEARRPQNPG